MILTLQEISNSKSSYRINLLSLGSHDLAKSINLKVSDDEKEITNFRQKIIDFKFVHFQKIGRNKTYQNHHFITTDAVRPT